MILWFDNMSENHSKDIFYQLLHCNLTPAKECVILSSLEISRLIKSMAQIQYFIRVALPALYSHGWPASPNLTT